MKQDIEDNIYFKILLDKIIELTKENENLKLEIEKLRKRKESKIIEEETKLERFQEMIWNKDIFN